ncbi:MAG: DUF6152 family protein [Steroidobacteraceae bacterium]
MKARLSFLSIISALLAIGASSVFAHHSFAMFDDGKELVITGEVTEFQWTNPHTWIEMDVPDASGTTKHWSIEGGSVLGLSRQGWKRTTIQRGDKISVVIHPLKSGEPGGSLMGVVTADGRALGEPLTAPPKK